ncbi:hypothetical protein AB0F72_18435 [Actinoplanes sp. NPDC023936]|uniref:hypothetical protein n=1 Tax=Actinoplanes sp. NPDC023936 TaxID=3154910 RepID=UPI0033EDEBF2
MRPIPLRALAAGALFAALATGCAGPATSSPDVATAQSAAPDAPTTPSPSVSIDPDSPLKYSQCMRENGMTWFPDPDTSGRMAVRVPSNVNQEDLKKAEEACRRWAPDAGEKPRMSAEDLEKARQMSKCMRENGVPNFPDPKPDGSISINGDKLGTGPGDPAFDKAEELCSQYLPKGRTEKKSGA